MAAVDTSLPSRIMPATLPSEALLDMATNLLAGHRVTVLTGAGVSTDSGIPDYRGDGAPVRTPMTIQQFMSSERHRKRYWAGSQLGWQRFAAAEPNAGHRALVALEASGVINGVITQNVDELHLRAGSPRVVDLHGSMSRVRCLKCGQSYAREAISRRISEANPWLDQANATRLRPDGDADVADFEDLILPECTVCDGILKPDVVFFGEFIPTEKFANAATLVRNAEALMIAGSSLAVNSGIRLLDQANKQNLPIVIINRGATKGDLRATIKIDAGSSETLTALAERLTERQTIRWRNPSIRRTPTATG